MPAGTVPPDGTVNSTLRMFPAKENRSSKRDRHARSAASTSPKSFGSEYRPDEAWSEMSGCDAPTGTRFARTVASGAGDSWGEAIATDGEPGAQAGDVGELGAAMLMEALTTAESGAEKRHGELDALSKWLRADLHRGGRGGNHEYGLGIMHEQLGAGWS